MFYWLFFEKLFRSYSPFRVFQYSTFRTAHGEPDRAAAVDRLGSVADRASARVSNRPAYSRRRAAIASQEGRHAHHGRLADLRLHRGADAVVGQSARSRGVGGAGGPDQFRRDRIPGRLHQDAQQAKSGSDGAPEAGAGSPGGAADRRAAAGDERPRRILHQHECAVRQNFQAGPADHSLAAQPAGPIRWRSRHSSDS